jgi:hypothetical protein
MYHRIILRHPPLNLSPRYSDGRIRLRICKRNQFTYSSSTLIPGQPILLYVGFYFHA